jgi:hypothetical protein
LITGSDLEEFSGDSKNCCWLIASLLDKLNVWEHILTKYVGKVLLEVEGAPLTNQLHSLVRGTYAEGWKYLEAWAHYYAAIDSARA